MGRGGPLRPAEGNPPRWIGALPKFRVNLSLCNIDCHSIIKSSTGFRIGMSARNCLSRK